MKTPTPCEIGNYGQAIGLPLDQCEAFFDHFEANGWRVGGKAPMKCWEAALRTWKRNWTEGVFRAPHRNGELSGADKMILQKELERVIEKIRIIQNNYGPMQTWAKEDNHKIRILRDRAREIRQKLGILL